MAPKDPALARLRLDAAVRRFIKGARLEKDRSSEAIANAPRYLEGTPTETTDLREASSHDLDYYVYELGRLQDVAREIRDVFDHPEEIVYALCEFEAAVPKLRAARNPLTHASDDERLDDIAWSNAIVRLHPSGRVEYLVDPRFDHHQAAENLAEKLLAFLDSTS